MFVWGGEGVKLWGSSDVGVGVGWVAKRLNERGV